MAQFLRAKKGWSAGFIMFAMLLIIAPVMAATPPDAGTALDNVKQPRNQPSATDSDTADRITVTEPGPTTPPDDQRRIRVNGFHFSGDSLLPETELLGLVQHVTGHDLTLADLTDQAAMISQYLKQKGFIVAFAYLPAQHVVDGNVEIAIVSGKYGITKVNNNSRMGTRRIESYLKDLKPGEVITRRSLERVLLLLNDLAGVKAKAALRPGSAPGTTELDIEISDAPRFNGSISGDNWGNVSTGELRDSLQLSLNDLAHNGDAFNLGGLATNDLPHNVDAFNWGGFTAGDKLTNFNCDYNMPLGGDGLSFDIKYSKLNYKLGGDFAILHGSGETDLFGLGLRYPVTRSRSFNLYASLGWDDNDLRDDISLTSIHNIRSSKKWNAELSGNHIAPSRIDTFSIIFYSGELTIDDPKTARQDASKANEAGFFRKFAISGGRQQALAPNLTLNLAANAQWADKNLDSSEKIYLGGADGVRAYPQGEGGGDSGWRLTGELQWQAARWSEGKSGLAIALFSDYGEVRINKDPWDATSNRMCLSDIGLGCIWSQAPGFTLRCDYALRLEAEGDEAATNDTGRIWVRAVEKF